MLGAATGSGSQPPASVPDLGDYEFRMFDDVSEMRAEIVRRDGEVGLSRLVAGYAWEWKTKGNKPGHDIEIGELRMRWNSTQTDWIASPGSLDEEGSIHTVQGDDLNYAGVIIGPDLRFDTAIGRIVGHTVLQMGAAEDDWYRHAVVTSVDAVIAVSWVTSVDALPRHAFGLK